MEQPLGNVEQVEAGLREVVRALLSSVPLDEAFVHWGISGNASMSLPIAVTFRHTAAAFRVLVVAGVCPPRATWTEFASTWVEEWTPAGLPNADLLALDRLVLVCAAEAGGAAISSVEELGPDPTAVSVMLLAVLCSVIEVVMSYGMAFDEVFRVANLARRPALDPNVSAAARAFADIDLRRS